jgi:hypothetical protein
MPILYADYEGLNAGEQRPFASEMMSKGGKSSAKRLVKKTLEGRSREIK